MTLKLTTLSCHALGFAGNNLPVGVHTGSGEPNHERPNFSEAMGNLELLRGMVTSFPRLKVWIMHGGAPYVDETIQIMRNLPNVYADLFSDKFSGYFLKMFGRN